jgi:hypothetical protein
MTSIDTLILQSTNPFDNSISVNFWHEQKEPEPIVESIHQEVFSKIEATLDQVIQHRHSRTVMLDGDGGSGKTYFLGRLKKAFNDKAFFAYIPPFPQSDSIWRHILRYTVDSLLQIPEGQTDSQLLLWVRSALEAIKQRSLKDKILKDDVFDLVRSDRAKFIKKLKETYKIANLYNAERFFGILHDLTVPELYDLACEWLRGDDLSEESLKSLNLKKSIDSETEAFEILGNFSKIAADTRPIVLCFDQIDSIAKLPDGSLDLEGLLNANTKINGEYQNFLVIISILTNTWRSDKNKSRIDITHIARINEQVSLKPISIDQAKALIISRLKPLHIAAKSKSENYIHPLSNQYLQERFPGGKTSPRDAIKFSSDIFQQYKKWLIGDKKVKFIPVVRGDSPKDNAQEIMANFKLKWAEEFESVKKRVDKIRRFGSDELVQILKETLTLFEGITEIQSQLLTGKYASYSFSYKLRGKLIGVVWTEDPNMSTFYNIMVACEQVFKDKLCQALKLIRSESIGKPKLKGTQKYHQIFGNSGLIIPSLNSVHYLATYHNFVKDAREGDLTIKNQSVGLKQLKLLISESGVLQNCQLLYGLIDGIPVLPPPPPPVKEFILNFMIKQQQFLARSTMILNAKNTFGVNDAEIEQYIQELCQENKISILNPQNKPKDQIICLVVTNSSQQHSQ